jgi:regulatory protein
LRRQTDDLAQIERVALKLLAAREHSVQELRRKLLARGFAEAPIDRVLGDLAQQALLSDARFAQVYSEQRVRKGFGPLRLRAELRERGVDEALIETSVDLDDALWMAELRAAHDKKYGPGLPGERAEVARRARFLQYRGFTAAQVARLLKIDD